jgi:polar amino acid transport system substrate-binding protein
MFPRRIKSLLVVLFILSFMAACSGMQKTETTPEATEVVKKSDKVLRVGISTDSAPLIYKEAGEIVGLEADFARELGTHLGKSVHFVELKFQELIPALLEDRIDIIMSGLSITKMREIQISFSSPYFRTGQMALVHSANKAIYPSNYYSILGMSLLLKIGVIKGTTGETFVRRNFGSAREIQSLETLQESVDKLLVGKLDMVIHDAPMILAQAARNQAQGLVPMPTLLTEEYLAWGVRKGDTELLDTLNIFVTKIKIDGRIIKMVKRWIPYDS